MEKGMKPQLAVDSYRAACRWFVPVYAVMLVMAWHFTLLRTVFADASFVLFHIVKDAAFAVQAYRFASMATQFFAWLPVRLDLPLEAVLRSYSLGIVLFNFAAFAVCAFALRSFRFALVIALLNVLFITHLFFWIQTELPQGLVWLVIGFALVEQRDRLGLAAWPLAAFVFATAAFAHYLVLVPFVFIVGYLLLRRDPCFNPRLLAAASSTFVAVFLVKLLFFPVLYDSESIGALKAFVEWFPNYFNLKSNFNFFRECIWHYQWLVIAWLAANAFFIKRRVWLMLVWFNASAPGYLLLINVTYFYGQLSFHAESMYTPLALIVGVPVVFELLPLLRRRFAIGLVAVLGVSFFVRVFSVAPQYERHRDWMVSFLESHRERKLVIPERLVPMDTLMLAWGSPYEWWMLSTLRYNETASLIIHHDPALIETQMQSSDVFITQYFGIYHHGELPKRYFNFTNRTDVYTLADSTMLSR